MRILGAVILFVAAGSVFGAGLEVGAPLPSYNPVHLTGADKGTKT
jgi:hypothetical protein